MNESCLFCKIADGSIGSKKIYEDDKVFAFYDIDPQSPVHFLVIPKQHIKSADEIDGENAGIIAEIFVVIAKIAKQLGLSDGYRIVNNCGEQGGQTVDHLHFHVLSGRNLMWPPG